MKPVLLLLSGGLLGGCPALAQDFVNAGTLITVQPGASVYVGTGGLLNRAGGTFTNGGALRVTGPLTNAGTLNLSTGTLESRAAFANSGTLTPGTSAVTFSGAADQLLTPGGATLYQVLVSKPTAGANTLRLAGDLTVSNLLQLTSGYVNTQAPGGTVYTLRLPNGASLSGEASGRYVQGALQITRAAVSGAAVDFGHGVVLDPNGNNLGSVSITRTAGLQLADVSYGQNLGSSPKGIDRIWTVTPTTQPSTPVDLTLSWLPDNDNGLVGFSQVQLWQQPTTGQPWAAVGPTANASTRLFSSSVTVLNRFTVSNNASVAPVTLLSFTPSGGPVGSTFAIAGTNLTGATTITFTPTSGPATAVSSGFVVAGGTSITGVPVPAGLVAGVYTVTVTAAGGTSNGLPFTVTTSASTATPVVTAPTPNQVLANTLPTYAGTAPAGSTVTVYVDGISVGTTTALGTGNFSLAQPVALAQGLHQVFATAQLSGQPVSAGSAPIAFTVDTVAPMVASLSSPAGTSGSSTGTAPLAFSVTFSEPVTGFSAAGISVTNGTVASGPTGSGAGPYTFSVTPTTPGTATTVIIAANAAQDAAGTGNAASLPFSLTYLGGSGTPTTWTANAGSQDWFTPGNWSAGVPTASSDVLIQGGAPFYPVLPAGAATARALTITSPGTLTQNGGTLAVASNLLNNGTLTQLGGTLTVGGDITNNGAFTTTNAIGSGGGTVVLGTGSAGSALLGSSAIRFWNLMVQANGARLGTSAGASVRGVLTLGSNFATQGNSFTIESASTGDALVVNNSGAVVGNATVQRYIDPSLSAGLGYHHYAAAVSNSTVSDLLTTGFTPVINPAYNTSAMPANEVPFPTVYGYDESRLVTASNNLSGFIKGYFSPAALSAPLAVGWGYTVNIAASQLVDFVGTLNNGDLSLSLANNRAGDAEAGWHLVGNPYPAPLDYSLVAVADKVNLEGAMYVYSSTSQYAGVYRPYNNGIGNPIIPMGQGFFVRTAGTSAGALTFRNSQRLTVPNATTFQRTAETRPLVQLTLQAAGSAGSSRLVDELYVYAQAGATAGFDVAFDAEKLPNLTGLNLSAQAGSQQLAIDGLPELNAGPHVVPLAVGVPAPGSYTLAAKQLLNLANVPVYLRDLQTGALIDLAQQPAYSFTAANAAALITGRFELVFSPQPLATVPAALAQQVALYPNPATTSAQLELPPSLSRQPVTATLLDAVGREVRTQVLPAGQASHALQISGLATGVYALRLRTEAGVVVKKLVVE
ncbi:MAG: T9SS type A sorting domain-containing protein [Janthinobacterium lividum]